MSDSPPPVQPWILVIRIRFRRPSAPDRGICIAWKIHSTCKDNQQRLCTLVVPHKSNIDWQIAGTGKRLSIALQLL